MVTLPRPEYIPDNVKLLISGQPQESYPNYPLWLKRKDDNVKRLDVPGIERGDILSLVTQRYLTLDVVNIMRLRILLKNTLKRILWLPFLLYMRQVNVQMQWS